MNKFEKSLVVTAVFFSTVTRGKILMENLVNDVEVLKEFEVMGVTARQL